jgi:hypothetical protein
MPDWDRMKCGEICLPVDGPVSCWVKYVEEKLQITNIPDQSLRQTGRTTRMLLEAIEMLPNACINPILIYGANEKHARQLCQKFDDIVRRMGMETVKKSSTALVINGDERVEFKSFYKEDSPPGGEYSHIFIDHYAKELYPDSSIDLL